MDDTKIELEKLPNKYNLYTLHGNEILSHAIVHSPDKEKSISDFTLEEKLRALFEEGITIRFDDYEKTFIAFDKSGSMSRNSRITFIDREIVTKINKRLLLDIYFTHPDFDESWLKINHDENDTYISYLIDLNNYENSNQFLSSHDTTALFYQISRLLIDEKKYKISTNSLSEFILFVDFGNLFNELSKNATEDNPLYQGIIGIYTRHKHEVEAKLNELKTIDRNSDEFNSSFSEIEEELKNKSWWNKFVLKFYDEHLCSPFEYYLEDNTKTTTEESHNYDWSDWLKDDSRILFDEDEEDPDPEYGKYQEPSGIKVTLSKFYAYKGLYLSSGTRVNLDYNLLNSDSVIVLKDEDLETNDEIKIKTNTLNHDEYIDRPKDYFKSIEIGINARTLDAQYNPTDRPVIKEETIKKAIKKLFDGEGIISPIYAKHINQAIKYKELASSFQIRMPFIKGMLHEVDFHGFLNEFGCKKLDEILIEDAFGKERDLKKAHIILTESMFKGQKWLTSFLMSSRLTEEEFADRHPMDYYFKKFEKYNHAIYVTGSNIPYLDQKLTTLNYQFLNTLCFNKNEYDNLLKNHLEYIADIHKYIEKTYIADPEEINSQYDNLQLLNDQQLDEDSEVSLEKEDLEEDFHGADWKELLIKNPVISSHPYVRRQMDNLKMSLIKNIAYGKILVDGEVNYLSRDLMYFLLSILKKTSGFEALPEDKKSLLEGEKLKTNCFYSPSFNGTNDEYYVILRNPHLSRNEQSALKFLASGSSIRDKYLGHLKGVLMVAFDSYDPAALGGADFDGDTVKVIANEEVRNKVLTTTYKQENNNYIRELPVVVIDPIKSILPDEFYNNTVDFNVIRNTFSNNIGRLSNISAAFGKYQYGENSDEDSKDLCEMCTIFTGLDIDAAKTGMRNDFGDLIDTAKKFRKKKDYSYIEKFRKEFDPVISKRKYIYPSEIEANNQNYSYPKKQQEKKIEYTLDENYCSLELLPKYYFDALIKNDKRFEERVVENTYFKFECENWGEKYSDCIRDFKKSLDFNEPLIDTATLILALKDIRSVINIACKKYNYYSNFSKSNMATYILKQQYKDYGRKILEFNNMLQILSAKFKNATTAAEVFEELESSNWVYLTDIKDKRKMLKKILRLDVTHKNSIFYNFTCRGYLLLGILLMSVKCNLYTRDRAFLLRKAEEDFRDSLENNKKLASLLRKTSRYQDYFDKFFNICILGIGDNKKPQDSFRSKINMETLVLQCREILFKINNNDKEESFKQVCFISKKLSCDSVLWDLFDTEAFMNNIEETQNVK